MYISDGVAGPQASRLARWVAGCIVRLVWRGRVGWSVGRRGGVDIGRAAQRGWTCRLSLRGDQESVEYVLVRARRSGRVRCIAPSTRTEAGRISMRTCGRGCGLDFVHSVPRAGLMPLCYPPCIPLCCLHVQGRLGKRAQRQIQVRLKFRRDENHVYTQSLLTQGGRSLAYTLTDLHGTRSHQ